MVTSNQQIQVTIYNMLSHEKCFVQNGEKIKYTIIMGRGRITEIRENKINFEMDLIIKKCNITPIDILQQVSDIQTSMDFRHLTVRFPKVQFSDTFLVRHV